MASTAAFHARVCCLFPGLGGLKGTLIFLPHSLKKLSIVGSIRDREVSCSTSDLEGLNIESCVWRAVSFHSSHHPQEVFLVQFSLYLHSSTFNSIYYGRNVSHSKLQSSYILFFIRLTFCSGDFNEMYCKVPGQSQFVLSNQSLRQNDFGKFVAHFFRRFIRQF